MVIMVKAAKLRVKRQAAGKVAGLHGKATSQYHIEGDFIRSSIRLWVGLLICEFVFGFFFLDI